MLEKESWKERVVVNLLIAGLIGLALTVIPLEVAYELLQRKKKP